MNRKVVIGALAGFLMTGIMPIVMVYFSIEAQKRSPNPDPSAGSAAIAVPFFLVFFGPVGALLGAGLGYQHSKAGVINPFSKHSRFPLVSPSADYIQALGIGPLEELDRHLAEELTEDAEYHRRQYLREQLGRYSDAWERTLKYAGLTLIATFLLPPIGWVFALVLLIVTIRAVLIMRLRVKAALERWQLSPTTVENPFPITLR